MFDEKPAPKKKQGRKADERKSKQSRKTNNEDKGKKAAKTTRFKRENGVRPEDQINQRNFSAVKLKLRTVLKASEEEDEISPIRQLIAAHSIRATKICSLASLLLLVKVNEHFDNPNHNPNDDFFRSDAELIVKDCFYEILNPIKTQGGKRYVPAYPRYSNQHFATLMQQYGIERPNNNYMGNMFKYLFQMYGTNFKTNICLHGRKRIWNFFKTYPNVSKMQLKHTVEYLFDTRSLRQPNNVLMDALRSMDVDNRYNFNVAGSMAYFENDWFYYVPLFLKIQRHVYDYNMQNAAEWLAEDKANEGNKGKRRRQHPKVNAMHIVPICKYKRQHIRIDTAGLFKLVQELGELPAQGKGRKPTCQITETEFIIRAEEFWTKYIDVDMVHHLAHKSNRKVNFANQLVTDGVSASILYEVQVPTEGKFFFFED